MKPINSTSRKPSRNAFTVWDLLIVLVTVGLLLFLLPMWAFNRRGAPAAARINCVSNLKQVGLAFRMWANDHAETFPMALSTNQEGAREFIASGEIYRHFQIISNELSSPRVLTCNSDRGRNRSANFLTLGDSNLSYFVGLDARGGDPRLILSGDRNVGTNGRLISGLLTLTNHSQFKWTKDLHAHAGNLGLADGSAQQVTDIALQRQINSTTNLPERLAIP